MRKNLILVHADFLHKKSAKILLCTSIILKNFHRVTPRTPSKEGGEGKGGHIGQGEVSFIALADHCLEDRRPCIIFLLIIVC